jgi:antirestriction protein ArdC
MNVLIEATLDRLVQNIEAGLDWKKTWIAGGGLPTNYKTKRHYSGTNVLLLWAAQQEHAYRFNQWATYRQWQEAGYQVRGGEKSHVILIVRDTVADKGKETEKHYRMFKVALVFNADQITVIPADCGVKDTVLTEHRHERCAALVAAAAPSIVTGEPSYSPKLDVIGMPVMAAFESADAYYSTLFHEMIHWTGHGTRLDRMLETNGKGSAYAFEELIAELGAAFIDAEFGIVDVAGHDNSAAYLSSWLKFFKDDKAAALMKAASAASKAVEFINAKQKETQQQAA